MDDQSLIPGRVLGVLFLDTMSRLALQPIQPPIQWVLEVLLPRIKQLGLEADHSPPSNTKVKNA